MASVRLFSQRGGAWFHATLEKACSAAGLDLASSNDSEPASGAAVVFSIADGCSAVDMENPSSFGVIIPFNEDIASSVSSLRNSKDWQFLIVPRDDVKSSLEDAGIIPSCFIRWPLITLSEKEIPYHTDPRPLSIFFPAYGSMQGLALERFAHAAARLIIEETGLSDVTVFLEANQTIENWPCELIGIANETSSSWIADMVQSKMLWCFSSPVLHEVSWIDAMANKGKFPCVVRIDHLALANETERFLNHVEHEALSWSEARLWLLNRDLLPDARTSRPLIDICSTPTASAKAFSSPLAFAASAKELGSLLRSKPFHIDWDPIRLSQDQANFELVEKLKKLADISTQLT